MIPFKQCILIHWILHRALSGKCARLVGISGRRFDVLIKTSVEDVFIRPIELTVDFFEGEK